MKLIVLELKARGYLVWFDLERMKGSVMDAMSEAVEGAELMLYGVSEKYKEVLGSPPCLHGVLRRAEGCLCAARIAGSSSTTARKSSTTMPLSLS